MLQKLNPLLWGAAVMVAATALALYTAVKEKIFLEANQIVSPDVAVGPATLYFFAVVGVLALVLFIIPLSKLQIVFRILFAITYGWGVFIVAGLNLLEAAAYPLAIIAGIAWLFWARVWLHNLLLLITLAGAGSVYGFLFSPWTFLIVMLIIAVYDFLAVKFGFMVWMADKLSESTTLPAFIFPRKLKDWTLKVTSVKIGELKDEEPEKREYSILGGGDIGFPLMLVVAEFFQTGPAPAVVVSAFALVGLMAAFLIQLLWLKGKPMPALPPIAIASLIGLLVATQYMR